MGSASARLRQTPPRGREAEAGLTMFGFLFVVAVVLVATVVGFRVLPAYVEYFSVQRALVESLSATREFNEPSEVRRHFQRRVDSGYIESVGGRDVDLTKNGNEIVATVAWTRKLPLVANVSLLIEFEASAKR